METKFRYYIISLEDGDVMGTNNVAYAEESNTSDLYAVIDTHNAMTGDGQEDWIRVPEVGQDYESESYTKAATGETE